MTLTVELTDAQTAALERDARRQGLTLGEYAARLLAGACGPVPALHTGAELVAHWQAQRLVGTRPDIPDSGEHARALRERAERRERETPT